MSNQTNAQLQRKIALYEKNVFNLLNRIESGLQEGQNFKEMEVHIHDTLYWHSKRLFAIHELQVRESHVIEG